MRPQSILITSLLGITSVAGGQQGGAPPGDPVPAITAKEANQTTQSRLAVTLTRYARTVLGTNPLSVQGLAAAMDLLQDATALDPNLEEAWRMLLDLAMLTDRPEVVTLASSALIKLAPDDSAALLERLLVALDNEHTVETRDQFVRGLLSDENLPAIGADVGSRLALRMAMMERRAGNFNLFHQWLQRSVALDPTNLDANAFLIGIDSGLATSDPQAWANMLLRLMLLNPTNSGTTTELGHFLLDHGAYGGAAKILELTRQLEFANGRDAGSALDADLILAFWASGDDDSAKQVLDERQTQLNELFRQIAMKGSGGAGSERTALEVGRLTGPLSPKLAMLKVMLAVDHADPTHRADVLDELATAIDHRDRSRQTDDVPLAGRAPNYHRLLWTLVILEASPGAIDQARSQIEKLLPLDDQQKALLDAMTGTSETPEAAEKVLQASAKTSLVARIGLAELLQKQGRLREAGNELLGAWRSSPGTVLGVLASRKLATLIGTPIELSDTARTLDTMINELPSGVFRLATEPSLMVSFTVEPRKREVEPYAPMLLDVTIFNHTPEPLTISDRGPIKDLIVMEPFAELPYMRVLQSIPVLLDIGRALRIEPHGTLEFSFDLQTTWVGDLMANSPLYGGQFSTQSILNPRFATASNMNPVPTIGALGSKATSSDMRLNGKRVSEAWIREVLTRVTTQDSHVELVDMALLSHSIARIDAIEGAVEMPADLASECVAALIDAWPRLDPTSQAWLVSVLAWSDRLDRLWSMIESNLDPVVQRVVLMRLVSRNNDPGSAAQEPSVVAGLTSSNESVRALAEWIEATLQISAEQQFK